MSVGKDVHQKRRSMLTGEGIKHGQEVGGNDTPAAQTRARSLQRCQTRVGCFWLLQAPELGLGVGGKCCWPLVPGDQGGSWVKSSPVKELSHPKCHWGFH